MGNECEVNPQYMYIHCRKSCDTCSKSQSVKGEEREKVLHAMQESQEYYMTEVLSSKEYVKVRKNCKNRHELCTFWKILGECGANPKYMTLHCALACMTCLDLDLNHRCPMSKTAGTDALKENQLKPMFEN